MKRKKQQNTAYTCIHTCSLSLLNRLVLPRDICSYADARASMIAAWMLGLWYVAVECSMWRLACRVGAVLEGRGKTSPNSCSSYTLWIPFYFDSVDSTRSLRLPLHLLHHQTLPRNHPAALGSAAISTRPEAASAMLCTFPEWAWPCCHVNRVQAAWPLKQLADSNRLV